MRALFRSVIGTLVTPLMLCAGTIYVSNTSDSGAGSFRQAVNDAASGDTVDLTGLSGVISLTSGEVVVAKDLQIVGPGADKLAIDGSGQSRILRIDDSQPGNVRVVSISGLVIRNGQVTGANGGGIYNTESLTLSGCSVSGNVAAATSIGGNGGGIYNIGTLIIEDCSILDNRASDGGGVAPETGNGGGICNSNDGTGTYHGVASLMNSTISGNMTDASPSSSDSPDSLNSEKRGFGGGVFNDSNLNDSTANDPATMFGCIGQMNLLYCTITNNTATFGGGIANYVCILDAEVIEDRKAGGDVSLQNTVVSGNQSTYVPTVHEFNDIVGPVHAEHSLITHISGTATGDGNIMGVDAGLQLLTANGGPTLTYAPRPGSPLIGGGMSVQHIDTDQTGGTREIGTPDIGAFEAPLDVYEVTSGKQAQVSDADGDQVTFRLDGNGTAYVYIAKGADPTEIIVKGSSRRTALNISTAGHTSVRYVSVEGTIGNIDAPRVDLDGDLTAGGSIRSLSFADANGPGTISIGRATNSFEDAQDRAGTGIELGTVTGFDLKSAGPIAGINVDSWTSATDRTNTIQASSIGTVSAAGWLDGVYIVSKGDIDSVRAAGMKFTQIMAGMRQGMIGMPAVDSDISARAQIGEVLVSGRRRNSDGYSTINCNIAARLINSVTLTGVNTDNSGVAFGVGGHTIKTLSFQERVGRRWRWNRYHQLTKPGVAVHSGDFIAAIFNLHSTHLSENADGVAVPAEGTGVDVPFSFAVTDDSRGGLILSPGVASWNLKWMFQDAFNNNCKFVIIPGDVISGGNLIGTNIEAHRQYRQLLDPWNSWYNQLGTNLYCTRGNHETYFIGSPLWWTSDIGRFMPQDGPTTNSRGLDERGFSFTFSYGNTFFVCLDEYRAPVEFDGGVAPCSYCSAPSFFCLDNCQWIENGQPQSGSWLGAKLNAYHNNSSLKHCFTFGHCPLYTSVTRTDFINNNNEAKRDQFKNLVNGVAEVYFTGHDHLYDHCIINNTVAPPNSTGIDALHEILVGTAGADLDWDAVTPPNPGYVRDSNRQYLHDTNRMGYNLVTVSGNSVTITFRAFTVKKHEWAWEFDQITGFEQKVNTWSYVTGK